MNMTAKEIGLMLHLTLPELNTFCIGISLFFCPS